MVKKFTDISDQIEISKFNPKILEKRRLGGHSPTIVFIAPRGSGKSSLLVDILYHMRELPAVIVMSGTEDSNQHYNPYVHELCIYNKFDKNVIGTIIDTQKKKVSEMKKNSGISDKDEFLSECAKKNSVGIIMDDLAFNKKDFKEKELTEIFYNGRHMHITTMITFQYMMDLNPNLRSNIDYVFVAKENRRDNVERLYRYFFGIFDTVADFKKVLNQCTNDYSWLVLDNTSRSDKISDNIFWYKATLDREYRIAPKMWPKWDAKIQKNREIQEKTYEDLRKSTLVVKKKGPRPIDEDDEYT